MIVNWLNSQFHYNVLEYCACKLVRVVWPLLTDNVASNPEQEAYVTISIDFEKNILRSYIKITFLPPI